MCESSSSGAVSIEIVQLERNELVLLHQQQMLAALMAALDSCKDLIHITDAQHRIQVREFPRTASGTLLRNSLSEATSR